MIEKDIKRIQDSVLYVPFLQCHWALWCKHNLTGIPHADFITKCQQTIKFTARLRQDKSHMLVTGKKYYLNFELCPKITLLTSITYYEITTSPAYIH